MCVSLQRRAIQNFKMYVLLQRRAQKCMNPAHDVRGNPRHTKITISPQFRTSDQHEVTRGFTDEVTNLHFTTVLDVRWARNDERVARRPRPIRISPQFWTSDEHEVTRGLRRRSKKICISPQFWTSDEHETTRGLRRRRTKFAFHLSFGRPMSTKWREGGLPSWSTKPTLR